MSGSSSKVTNWLKIGLIGLGVLATVIAVFGAGFWLGRTSASQFGYGSSAPFSRESGRNEHGATGTIQEIADQKIILKMRDGKTQTILVNSETRFDKGLKQISQSDLKVNDRIIVLGSPNPDGEIVARLVGLVDSDSSRSPHDGTSPGSH